MANFFKHVGEYNSKRVVIVQREIPGEAHMCSVIFSQIIPKQYHDDIMKVLESEEGQSASEFVDILNRRQGSNGVNLLQAIAQEGYLKKVPSAQVLVKPNSKSGIRLDELNNILRDVGRGEQAHKQLEQMDRELGYQTNRDLATRTSASDIDSSAINNAPQVNSGAMDNTALAKMNMEQVNRMRVEAQGLLNEADRLEKEAQEMDPSLKPTTKTARKKTAAKNASKKETVSS